MNARFVLHKLHHDQAVEQAVANGARQEDIDAGMSGPDIDAINAAAPADKPFENARARAALAGVTLYRTQDDAGRDVYVASQWAQTRQFDSLECVADFLDLVGGRRK